MQDVNRPAAPANARVQIIAVGKFETDDPAKPATSARQLKRAPRRRKRSAETPPRPGANNGPGEEHPMFNRTLPGMAGFILGISIMITTPAGADALKDEIAPTGKLRVAIAISPAGGAFWSTKTESGYAGVPVDLGREMAAQLGVSVEYVAHETPARSSTPPRRAPGTSPSCRRT